MDILLEALSKSIKHLEILDEVLSHSDYPEHEEYEWVKSGIKEICSEKEESFLEELYVGGKGTGYSRVMILSDILTYIISGRGYFYAARSEEKMRRFIGLILFMVNQLMLFDSIGTNIELRRKFLHKMKQNFTAGDLFKEELMRKEHDALVAYSGPIGFPLKQFNPEKAVSDILAEASPEKCEEMLSNYYDSLLPKSVGLQGELLTYAYMLRQRMGYLLPLLLTQELISGAIGKKLKVPDIIAIPFNLRKERMFGIEIGPGKEIQSTLFHGLTNMIPTTKVNLNNPKRCTICGKWMLFCPVAINRFSDTGYQIDNFKTAIKCLKQCNVFTPDQVKEGACPYAMHKGGKPVNKVMREVYKTYHFHLKCLLQDTEGRNTIKQSHIVTYYPFVSGLEKLQLLTEDKDYEIKRLKNKLKEKEEVIRKLKDGQTTLTWET